jgi:ATP/maltotriose-dependent transcriptional regulator MalT
VARAVVLVELAVRPMSAGEGSAQRRRAAEQALEASLAAGAREQEATARIILGPALSYGGELDKGVSELRAGLELAQGLPDPSVAVRAYLNLSDTLELLGMHEEAAEEARRGLELASEVGLTQHVYGLYLVYNRAEALIALGRWTEAEQLLTDTLELSLSDAAVRALLTVRRGMLAALAGRYEDAARDLDSAGGLPLDTGAQYTAPLQFARLLVAFGRGDVQRARDHARGVLAAGADDPFSERYHWPVIWFGLRIEAETADANGDRVTSLRTALAEVSVTHAASRAYRALATAELARVSGTAPDWEPAIQSARETGDLYLLAYALLRGAQHAWSSGDRDAVPALLEEAAHLAVQMGAEPILDEVKTLGRRARLKILDSDLSGPAQGSRPPAIEKFGLTDREAEVLALVAAGRSNPQIAAELSSARRPRACMSRTSSASWA